VADYWFPYQGIDPNTGYKVGYSLYPAWIQAFAGGYFPGVYELSEGYGYAFSGWLKFTAPPIGNVDIVADQAILRARFSTPEASIADLSPGTSWAARP